MEIFRGEVVAILMIFGGPVLPLEFVSELLAALCDPRIVVHGKVVNMLGIKLTLLSV